MVFGVKDFDLPDILVYMFQALVIDIFSEGFQISAQKSNARISRINSRFVCIEFKPELRGKKLPNP